MQRSKMKMAKGITSHKYAGVLGYNAPPFQFIPTQHPTHHMPHLTRTVQYYQCLTLANRTTRLDYESM